MTTVHIIPHSHCDPGWLNTFEGYYAKNVQKILDGVVGSLSRDPKKKFVWAEISFFERWYETQSLERKRQFKLLVSNGQIEFVGGGWSQHDEALPDMEAIIDQVTEGHQYLQRNFGVQPRIAWQIDPFGHSATTPTLFSAMGFDAVVINRIHHELKADFKKKQHLEFIWKAHSSDPDKNSILAHVLYKHYSAPKGFDWEEKNPLVNDNRLPKLAAKYVKLIKGRARSYRSDHIMVPFGDDFKFKRSDRQFQNMDKLIEYVNERKKEFGVVLRYSTPSEYFKAVQTVNLLHPLFTGDFFPYADNEDSYWTGFYTTRPLLKQLSRKLGAQRRCTEILQALIRSTLTHPTSPKSWESKFKDISLARKESGMFLHHDAITGTCRSKVATDYENRMMSSFFKLSKVMASLLESALTQPPPADKPPPKLTGDPYTLSYVASQERGDPMVYPIVISNSLGWERKELVSIQVGSRFVSVTDAANNVVQSQVDNYWENYEEIAPHRVCKLHYFVSVS